MTNRVPTRICLRNVLASDLTAEPSPREWTGEGRVEEGRGLTRDSEPVPVS